MKGGPLQLKPSVGRTTGVRGVAITDECTRVEHVLAAMSGEEPEPDRADAPICDRLRAARERSGLSQSDVAKRSGLTPSEYWDLEERESEVLDCVTLAELRRIADGVGTTISELLFGEAVPRVRPEVEYADLSFRLARRLADESLSEASLCSVVGWDVGQALHDPEALDSYSVLALRDMNRPG